jgi:hypothetical protein
MKMLEQYHFDRDDFNSVFNEIFADRCFDLEVACQEHRETENFLLYYKDDEFYIIHFDSGIIINWYKHIGRTNTCNDKDFSLNDLREMLILLKEDLEWR